jgi:transcriptional regulator with XRE-family HTH domain
MVGRTPRNVAEYFGSQIHKERQKAKLSVLALAKVMRMSDAHLGRIEKGQRPPTAEIAQRLDEVFPHREGWFSDYYEASKQWTPAALKAWSEYENHQASSTDSFRPPTTRDRYWPRHRVPMTT